MARKSTEFRAQPGQRYTPKAVAVEEAEGGIEASKKIHVSIVKNLVRLANRTTNIACQLIRVAGEAEDAQEATAAAGLYAAKVANKLLAGSNPNEPMHEPLELPATEEPPTKRSCSDLRGEHCVMVKSIDKPWCDDVAAGYKYFECVVNGYRGWLNS